MRTCLVWLDDPAQASIVMADRGPWREALEAGPGLLLMETDTTVSKLYHHVKRLLPTECALMVAPLDERPKARLVAEGTVSWLRAHLPLPDRPTP